VEQKAKSEQAKKEVEEAQAKKEAEEAQAKKQAEEEQAKKEAEEQAKKEAEEQAKKEAEEKVGAVASAAAVQTAVQTGAALDRKLGEIASADDQAACIEDVNLAGDPRPQLIAPPEAHGRA
jgi:hypothetical protein